MGDHASRRSEVRAFLDDWRAASGHQPRCDAWLSGYDPAFSRELGRAGYLGMTWSSAYGGGDRSFRQRFVVTEELLRAGAPVAAHWIADRQIGPAVAHLGSETLRRELLPAIARGQRCVCLGMSEPESGSDLASVRTRLDVDGDDYRLHGQKIWTSNAHVADHAYVLARTDASGSRHEGLTECIVAMDQPGVEVRPIVDLRGQHHFNEVFFDGAHVPGDWIIGEVGNGWHQVTSQLAFERGGPERVLSTYPLLAAALTAVDPDDPIVHLVLGPLVARLAALRGLAWSVAGHMDAGRAPVAEAAGLKLLGTRFEVDVIEAVRTAVGGVVAPGSDLAADWHEARLASPGFSIRGGTSEVLTTILARRCAEERASPDLDPDSGEDLVGGVVREVLRDAWERGDTPEEQAATFRRARELGWHLLGVAEHAGGVGGTLADRLRLAALLGAHGCDGPHLEVNTALAHLAETPGVDRAALERGELAVIDAADHGAPRGQGMLDAVGNVEQVLIIDRDELRMATPARPAVTTTTGGALLPVDVDGPAVDVDAATVAAIRGDLDLLRGARLVGAMRAVARLSARHAVEREQFGRALIRFQAVGALVAEQRAAAELADAAVRRAATARPAAREPLIDAAVWVCTDAADTVARLAHQVHGAMGTTHEHPLHRLTRRLWGWRDQLGAEHARARRLGAWAIGIGEARLWDHLAPEEHVDG